MDAFLLRRAAGIVSHSYCTIGVYDRYMRRGVKSTLDATAPVYLQKLAACADEIAADWFCDIAVASHMRDEYDIPNESDELNGDRPSSSTITNTPSFGAVMSRLRALLKRMLLKRAHLTLASAEAGRFDDAVFAALRYHFAQA